MKKLLPLLLFSIVAFTSCNNGSATDSIKNIISGIEEMGEGKEIRVNEYAITVPGYMKENKTLNEEASLQYASTVKEFYVIVIDERKTTIDSLFSSSEMFEKYNEGNPFSTYANFMTESYTGNSDSISNKKILKSDINGMTRKQVTYISPFNGYNIFFNVNFIAGKKTYYQVFTWCMEKDAEKYKPVMEKMVRSLHEI